MHTQAQEKRCLPMASLWQTAQRTWAMLGLALALGLGAAAPAHATATVKTSAFEYDANGLLTSETVEPDDPQNCLTTVYTYDQYGNKNSSTSTPCAGATGFAVASAAQARTATTVVTVDSNSITSVTRNAKGHSETRVTDMRFGALTQQTGPNNRPVYFSYDAYGRKKYAGSIDGTHSYWEYMLCSSGGANCPTTVGNATVVSVVVEKRQAVNGAPLGADVRTYYDMLGRVVRKQTQGFDGGSAAAATLYKDAHYDARGQVVKQSVWYAQGSGLENYTEMEYDELGRVTQQSFPDTDLGSGRVITQITHQGLSSTTINPTGATKTTIKNAQGRVAKVIDNHTNTVFYDYDALGNLVQTVAAGITTTLSYNQRGQKTGMRDPAMGEWQYEYNVYGELVWQRDSLGRTTTMAYDVLGRMTTRNEADLTSTWSFDSNRIGELFEAASSNGYKRQHYFTGYGKPSMTRVYADNPNVPRDFQFTYDDNTGRLTRKTSPSSYMTYYEYTAQGYLKKVQGTVGPSYPDGDATYEVLEMDARGRVTKFRQGNGVVTVNTYDQTTNKLKNITAGNGNVLNQSYAYDQLGNLVGRADNSFGVGTTETFAYDTLDRLTNYTTVGSAVSPPKAVQIRYDARGNITYRSDVGTYQYDPQRPGRLMNVTLDTPQGAMANSGTRLLTYAYDDAQPTASVVNGLAMGNGTVRYTESQDVPNNRHTYRLFSHTSFGMAQSIAYGDATTQSNCGSGVCTANISMAYVYGPEHQRIKQVVTGGANAGTTWYFEGYEKHITPTGNTEERHYLGAGSNVFAVVNLRNYGPYREVNYHHHDYLGSLVAVTDIYGTVRERMAYDPWGKRRLVNGNTDVIDSIAGVTTRHGYTDHEHLDEIGLINMNARMYDPYTGRFLSADPFIQSPDNLQSYNRYSYVLNNPLAFSDPTGYFSFKKLFRVAVAIGIGYLTGGAVSAWITSSASTTSGLVVLTGGGGIAVTTSLSVVGGAIAGAAGGFAAGVVATGTLKGGLHGALTGGLFGAAGAVGGVHGADSLGRYAAHAGAGCISAVAGGGKCGSGAVSAVFGKYTTNAINDSKIIDGAFAKGVASAVAGGVGSVLTGGTFDHGAATAAFGYLFNACFNMTGACAKAWILNGIKGGGGLGAMATGGALCVGIATCLVGGSMAIIGGNELHEAASWFASGDETTPGNNPLRGALQKGASAAGQPPSVGASIYYVGATASNLGALSVNVTKILPSTWGWLTVTEKRFDTLANTQRATAAASTVSNSSKIVNPSTE